MSGKGSKMIMRAKMVLQSTTKRYTATPSVECEFSAVTGGRCDEDKLFHVSTPFAQLKMAIDNPAVIDKLELGKSYYVDFTEAPE